MKRIALLAVVAILTFGSQLQAAVPGLINFQGILLDNGGNPVANGSYSVTFKIYDAATLGNVLWTESQPVTTSSGLFTIRLGDSVAVPDSVFNNPNRWLGIKVSADPEMSPRQRLSSVGYSYVSSQWEPAGQDLYRPTGNVGIGTPSPGSKLDVNGGNMQVSGGDFGLVGDAGFFMLSQQLLPVPTLKLGSNGGWAGGIGFFPGNPTEALHITNGGDVGVGTSTPGSRLDVNSGNAQISGGDYGLVGDAGFFMISQQLLPVPTLKVGSGGGWTGGIGFYPGSPTEAVHITNGGNVGIGTNLPDERLQIKNPLNDGGVMRIGGNSLSLVEKKIRFGDGDFVTIGESGSVDDRLEIKAAAVGIGTATPAATLHVVGTAGNNTGVWSNLSDRRLKKDIEPIENALETLNQLQPVSYRWKDAEKDAQFGRVRGLIAQDVEKVIPEWVKTDPDGYKRIEPIGVDALLVQAIKELLAKNETLEKRVAGLEKELQRANSDESRVMGQR